jgi:hypothetical protein
MATDGAFVTLSTFKDIAFVGGQSWPPTVRLSHCQPKTSHLSVASHGHLRCVCHTVGQKSSQVLPDGVRMTGRVVGLPSTSGGGAGGGGESSNTSRRTRKEGAARGQSPSCSGGGEGQGSREGDGMVEEGGDEEGGLPLVLPVNKLYVPTLGSL